MSKASKARRGLGREARRVMNNRMSGNSPKHVNRGKNQGRMGRTVQTE